MRILHIYKSYPPVVGGIENHLRLLAEGQAQRGHEVTVLVVNNRSKSSLEKSNGVQLLRASRLLGRGSTPLSLELALWTRRLKADVTHLHFPYPPGEIAHQLLGRSRRVIMTYHSDVIRQRTLMQLYKPMLMRLLARINRIVVTSEAYLENSPLLRRFSEKCCVVPLGIDTEVFAQNHPERVESIRRDFHTPLILFVGRMRYYKGMEYLLEAMQNLNAHLLIIGEGPEEKKWKRLCRRLQLNQKVTFVGEVTDSMLPDYYRACDIFVLPASHRSEAFGLVQLEAMAARRPVVSTELGTGTSFVNENGRTGFVVPPRDPLSLGNAIEGLLRNQDLRLQMGNQGYERVRQCFSKDLMIERIEEVYLDALNS